MSASSSSMSLRPRLVGDAVVLGSSTVLGRRVVQDGCWCIERPSPAALSKLLSIGYGKRIAADDPLVSRLNRVMAHLSSSTFQAERLLEGLPEPLADADQRLAQADRLLKSSVAPNDLEIAMRREGLKLRPAPDWAEQLTLSDQGVVLGQRTVIVDLMDHPLGGTGLALEGQEAGILALLSIARRQLAPPDCLGKLAAISRALAAGETARAAIILAQLGQPPLTDQTLAKSLAFAAKKLRKGASAFAFLKGARLMPAGIGRDDWLKTIGKAGATPRRTFLQINRGM